MLTDESINLAMQILKRKFPDIDGLENTPYGKVHQFCIFGKKLVLVLHGGGCHWVCVANFIGNNKCARSTIQYFYSLNATGAAEKFIEMETKYPLLCLILC